jgi:hypothetical protein
MRYLSFLIFILFSDCVFAAWHGYQTFTRDTCGGTQGSCTPVAEPHREYLINSSTCTIFPSGDLGIYENWGCQRWIDSNDPDPCEGLQSWDQTNMGCQNGCPSGTTDVGGQCLPNVWCETLGGYISQNITCPPPNPQCSNGMVSCDELQHEPNQPPPENLNPGVNEGEEAGNDQLIRDDAVEVGQQNGAGAGAVDEMNNDGGFSSADASAIHDAATASAGLIGTNAEQVASDVYNTCLSLGYTSTSCRNVAIGAGQGFETGGNVAGDVWDGVNNGPLEPNTGDPCSPASNCNNNVYLACPVNQVWNGSSSNPQRIPTTNPDVCYPSYQNNYCNNYALNCQNGSYWSRIYESCIFDIPVDSCPAGTTLNAQTGTCDSNHIQPGNPSCPTGYQYTNLGCRPIATTTTRVTTEVQNPDGSTTTTETTQTVGGNQGAVNVDLELDILQGPCDPSAEDYFECAGLISEYDETSQETVIDGLSSHGTQVLDDAGQSIIDGMTGVETIQSDYADGIGSVLIDLYDFGNVTCNDITLTFRDWTSSGGCDQTAIVRGIFAWLLSLFTIWNIFSIATRGNE